MHADQPADLTTTQWVLLGEIVRHCPLPAHPLEHGDDLGQLIDKGLVAVDQTMVRATRSGMEALWYHDLH